MSWLNNFKISIKIGLIVALMAMVTIATSLFATNQMKAMEDANTDMVSRVGKSTTMSVRANRYLVAYVSTAFQLAVERTDAGNARLIALTASNRKDYESHMEHVAKNLPEKSSVVQPVVAGALKAFEACEPAIQFAAKTTSPEEIVKAAARLQTECVPFADAAVAAQGKMTDGLLAEADKASEQMALEANSAIRSIFIASGLGLLIGLAIALFIGTKGLARPIRDLLDAMATLARNDLKALIPGIERRDEVGDMARTVEIFKTNAIEVERLKVQLGATEGRSAVEQKAAMKKLADDFEGAIGEIIETVSSASTELEASASTLTATAVRSQELTTMVAAASEKASTNVQSVASATEELTSSVNEISRQVQESARMANEAVDQARKTNDRVGELSKAARPGSATWSS